MNKKIVIAGGTGFIGSNLNTEFAKLGYEVIIISRQSGHVQWGDEQSIIAALDGAEMLINLAGKSVNCRYNETNKAEILSSRTLTTKALGEAILKCKNPPPLWLNSSTATIYRDARDRPMTESTGEIGSGFSVDIATQWEHMFYSFQLPQTRQIALRIAVVLGDGSVMKPFKNLVKFGLGGKQGSGKQIFSWLHIRDLFNIILFIRDNPQLTGAYNCSSPNPVDNSTLMKTIRESMGVKLGLPAYEWMLKIGAFLIGTETELILKSRWVLPERLLEAGYKFEYPEIKPAIASIINID
ncbi:MAG: TIGR01777 family oxidoreductase [Mucilaginibacter sp.]|uniref:TIGR01777 family oxidoreductase n=1 Tax=Mucilaginibacter sp. TaxID=1882438 RepID=UPI0032671E16